MSTSEYRGGPLFLLFRLSYDRPFAFVQDSSPLLPLFAHAIFSDPRALLISGILTLKVAHFTFNY